MARSTGDVRALADGATSLGELSALMSVCRACPRLVEWRERVAAEKRRSYANETYWGRPVPGWGDDHPRILVVGLAPAAHGGNRTGRIFTGDRSGDWLFASMYRVGLAAKPTSTHAGDGQRLSGVRVVASVRCAPPANKPAPDERATCAPWLERELALASDTTHAIVVLGGYGWQSLWSAMRAIDYPVPRPRPAFGHGAEVEVEPPAGSGHRVFVLGCYHPSQQNTFTGKLTEDMLDDVFRRAAARAGV